MAGRPISLHRRTGVVSLIGAIVVLTVGCFPQAVGIPTPSGNRRPVDETTRPPVVYAPTVTPVPSPTQPIPTATATPDPTPTPTAVPSSTPLPTNTPVPVLMPFTVSDFGRRVTPFFWLAAGLATFRITHDGFSTFNVVLYDGRGNQVDVLADVMGGFDGAKAAQIGQDGDYLLNIVADRRWSIYIEQPRPSSAPPLANPLGGRGQAISPFFALNAGSAVFRLTHYGAGTFLVALLDRSGYPVATLVNTTGAYNGSRALKIDSGGVYLMNIQADGDWVIQVEQ